VADAAVVAAGWWRTRPRRSAGWWRTPLRPGRRECRGCGRGSGGRRSRDLGGVLHGAGGAW